MATGLRRHAAGQGRPPLLALVRSASRQLGDIALRFRALLRRLGGGAAAGPHPAAPALVTGVATWLVLTARHDLAPREESRETRPAKTRQRGRGHLTDPNPPPR